MTNPSRREDLTPFQDDQFEDLEALLAETEAEDSGTEERESASDDEFDDLGGFIDRSGYQGLAGMPAIAIPGKKYVCPVEGCSAEPWYQMRGGMSPPLCEEHAEVFVAAEDDDAGQP